MPLSRRLAELAIAAGFLVAALVISPIGIRLATGRLDLSPRITFLSLAFAIVLTMLAAAILARGRIRRACLYLLALIFPLALLAVLEAAAIAVHLADRIAPLEDLSIVASRDRWPPHFMSQGRKVTTDGLLLYRPYRGDGITINALGLRTPMPSPKKPDEWRIAVTGGSVAWGWRLLDADTIPVQLQSMLRRQGHPNVTVYNFAIDSIAIAEELAILKHFREIYRVDQVIFFTGANDATYSYIGKVLPSDGLSGLTSGARAFELIKVVARLRALLIEPSPDLLATVDSELVAKLAQRNTLRDGVIAANNYCQAAVLLCDFVLQPLLLRRKEPRGSEIPIARTLRTLYPRYGEVFATLFRTTLDTGLSVHDSSDIFDRSHEPYFFDVAHINEAGSRLAAARLAQIASTTILRAGNAASSKP